MTSIKNPYFFLLGGLLVALLVAPLTAEHLPGIAGLILTGTLLIAILSLAASKRMYMAAWSLVAAKIVLDVVGYVEPSAGIHIAETVVMFAFFVLATAFSFKRVLEGDLVDMNRIAGGISIYMLIGLIWASLYFFLSLVDPQAFNGVSDFRTDDVQLLRSTYMDLLYYSYVTLSTLGYGEITPASRAAQSFAYLEAICGVMYIAVLVSALVGSYGSKRVAQA
jgi:hypothetical protein